MNASLKISLVLVAVFLTGSSAFGQVAIKKLPGTTIHTTGVSTRPIKSVSDTTLPEKHLRAVKLTNPDSPLLDAFAYAYTGYDEDLGCGKDGDTHWSFGLFDQNDRPVASFHDDSDNDEYEPLTGRTVKMRVDYPARFSDFAHGGHIHVNIAPKGHDTWFFEKITLTFDFGNPNFTMTFSATPGTLSQDHRDADLYFTCDGQNFATRN